MAEVKRLNNNNSDPNNNKDSFTEVVRTDLYGEKDNKVIVSGNTRQKIIQLKQAQKEVNRILDFQKNKSYRNYKEEIKDQTDSKKGVNNYYLQKSFAGFNFPIPITNNPNKFRQLELNDRFTKIFDPNNITIDQINKIKKKSVINPYNETTYDRCEESFRTDGTLKRGVLKKWDFILGADMKVILELCKDYESKEEKRKMLKSIYKFLPYKIALNEARYIISEIDFKSNLYDAGVQSSVYNRAAVEKIRSLDGTIIGLNVLETRFLGNPIYLPINSITKTPIDQNRLDITNTSQETNPIIENQINYGDKQRRVRSRHIYWKLFGIEYNDPESILNSNNPENIEIIQMKDLLYITRDNLSVSPGTKGFGLSEIEPSLDGSETKRIMKTYDFKEIARSSYSSFGVIKALNSNITKDELQYLVDSMKVNGWCATAHQIEVDTFSLTSDARIMIEILDAMNRETGRDIDVPSPLLGYEHVQNYASLQQTLQSWKESVLDADRRRIKELIEKQLLEEMLETSLKRQGYCIKLNERFELQLYEIDPMTQKPKIDFFTGFERKPTMLYEDDVTGKIELIEVPPIRLSFEISDPNFSIFKDKGEIGIQLKNINAISVEKLLELVDMPDEIDDAIKREVELQERDRQAHDFNIMEVQNRMSNTTRKVDTEIMKMSKEMNAMDGMDKFLSDNDKDKLSSNNEDAEDQEQTNNNKFPPSKQNTNKKKRSGFK